MTGSDIPTTSATVGDRQLNVSVRGADDGLTLVFHPGTPAPPVRWDGLDAAARERGLRLISYARPGYSGSTRIADRSVADAAADTAAVLDELGISEFVTVGHSGGGPRARACARLLPERCLAATSLAGVAPFDGDGLDWLDGMADENVEEFGMVLRPESELRTYLLQQLAGYATVTADDIAAALGRLVSDVDQASLTGELADMMARSLRSAAADGLDGWVDDDRAFVSEWGFDLASIETPVAVWQGRHDRMVPFAHGEVAEFACCVGRVR